MEYLETEAWAETLEESIEDCEYQLREELAEAGGGDVEYIATLRAELADLRVELGNVGRLERAQRYQPTYADVRSERLGFMLAEW